MGEALRTEPARHPIPLGDALLDKRNASYQLAPALLHLRDFDGAVSVYDRTIDC